MDNSRIGTIGHVGNRRAGTLLAMVTAAHMAQVAIKDQPSQFAESPSLGDAMRDIQNEKPLNWFPERGKKVKPLQEVKKLTNKAQRKLEKKQRNQARIANEFDTQAE